MTLAVFGIDVTVGLRLIADGAFGDAAGQARTLVKATPLILTGLGMAVAWRAGVYNVGGEGQYVIGGLAGAAAYLALPGGGPVPILVAAVAAGALLAGFAGWLQAARGVQAVISTILLNFVALQVQAWAVRGPLQQSKRQLPQTEGLPDAAMFLRFDRQTDAHAGMLLVPLAVVLVWVLLFRTRLGFQMRLVGQNPRMARANRIDPGRQQIVAMLWSGGLCGFAGGLTYLGVTGFVGDGFAEGWGFLAIPVALLGGLHPAGVLGGGLYFGALAAGCDNLARFTTIGPTLVSVVQGVAVLAFVGIATWLKPRWRPADGD